MGSHGRPWTGRPARSVRLLVLLPLVLIALITVTDVLAPPDIHLGPLLVVAPALTASFAGPRVTAAVAAVAVAAQFLIAEIRNSITTSNHLTQILALMAVSAVVVFFCRLREHRDAELAQVRSVSDAAQQVLLRPPPARLGPLLLASAYQAAVDEARIGGDFYAAVRTPRGARLLIGDVRGKGLEAVDNAALILGAFRAAAHRNPGLPELAGDLDGALSWNTAPEGADTSEDFATAVLIDIPDDQPVITLLSCGHPPPLLLRRDCHLALEVPDPAPPLGLAELWPHPRRTYDFPFAPGETLLLYTDGVIEARGEDGVFIRWRTGCPGGATTAPPGS
ncbi:PP2C family protein-serine/threonine phosphatase [Peterkaempfera sp. SMS 1(5)a]|uniref:PP2C family protein-serine/threonine phosphatase n=1 Tax=Peterkaempfera podocarpi TaxID=3232308 RepID=UPI00366EF641